ncbi:MAG TPA: chorismate synthase [Acidobacteriaceae bacterium]|nr:chorismate synthase [Acidobacteriaceae bacterium]
MLRFSTAGESHGECLIALISGLPAGLDIDLEFIDRELWRRQQGYGRGGRMRIEQDRAHILSGVRHGKTIGSPVAIQIENRDWKNWTEVLPVGAGDPAKHKAVASPRPGHADLAGSLKYDFPDARYVLERASARESTARVAAGAMAKLLLKQLRIEVASHVVRVGPAELPMSASWDQVAALRDQEEILLNCVDPETEQKMKAEVDHVLRTGDSIGGVFEVVVHGAPPGLGTYANWDERLDGLLAWAVMSLQAVKAVEIGQGVTAAESFGSAVHDAIGYSAEEVDGAPTRFTRDHNNAGGIEGGISNGEDIVVRGYLKPISTLRRPLGSVSYSTREPVKAAYERSDVCVVPAAGVAAEAMVAFVIARLALEKFGADSAVELSRNYDGYLEQIRRF